MPVDADSLDVRLLRFRSRRDEPAHRLALSLLEAGRPVEALEVAQAGLAEAEDDTRLLVLEGRAWFEQGDLVQAQAALLRAARLSPDEKEPYRWLSQLMMKRGEPGRAVQVLERALKIDPSDAGLRQALARAERLAKIAMDVASPEPPASALQAQVSSPAIANQAQPRPAASSGGPAKSPWSPSRPASLPERSPPKGSAQRASKPGAPGAFEEEQTAQSARPQLGAPALRADTEISTSLPWGASSQAEGGGEADEGETLPPKLATAAALASKIAAPAPLGRFADEVESDPPPGVIVTPVVPALGNETEDEPTVAFELPPELASLLERNDKADELIAAASKPVAASAKPQPGPPAQVPPPMLAPQQDVFQNNVSEDDEEEDDERTVVRPSLELIEPQVEAHEKHDDGAAEAEEEGISGNAAAPASVHVDFEALSEPPRSPSAADETDRHAALADVAPVEPDPPEKILATLHEQGMIDQRGDAAAWAEQRETEPSGQSVRRSLTATWVAAVLLAGGGAYGYHVYRDQRRAEAKTLIAQAVRAAHEGEHAELVAAERDLARARELDAKEIGAVEALLFVHAARSVEDLQSNVGYLRGSIARAQAASISKPLVSAAKAVLALYDQNRSALESLASEALSKGASDARVSYLVGRLYQRMGRLDAEALLVQATQKDADLALAWLALGELLRQTAREDEARAAFEKALGHDKRMLRAELWSILLDSTQEPAEALLARLDALAPRLKETNDGERFLAAVVRAGVLITLGDREQARAVVRSAATAMVADPEALSLLADRAAGVGEHDIAYRFANAAMARAPENRRYRDALANVLLKRGDGSALLAALKDEGEQSPWLRTMRARAALLSGSREGLDEAKRALSAYRQTEEGRNDYDSASLLLRVDLRLGANAESLLAAARSLVEAAPDNPLAQTALGETYLGAGQAAAAAEALEKARRLGFEDADVYALLGRAYRSLGEGDKAERALKQALALSPSHIDARQTYGSFLLDRGEFAAAENLYAGLEKERASVGSTLGIVEALLGRGEISAAKERLASLNAEARATPAAIAVSARLAIADKRPGAAVALLAPLVAEDQETRTVEMLTLYGDALYAASSVDTAAGIYEAALELDPTFPDALVGRAMAALRAEKIAQAIELLNAADKALTVRERPLTVRALSLVTRGKALILQSQFANASKLLAEALKLPAPAEVHFWYAETLAKEKVPGAFEQYTRYLELEPHGEFAERAKKALEPR